MKILTIIKEVMEWIVDILPLAGKIIDTVHKQKHKLEIERKDLEIKAKENEIKNIKEINKNDRWIKRS